MYDLKPPLSLHDLLIFTDMDGTLLNHDTYSFDAAKPTLLALQSISSMVIPNTSKTFSELMLLRTKMGLSGPFIIENGAAVYIPKEMINGANVRDFAADLEVYEHHAQGFYVKRFSRPIRFWRALLSTLNEQHSDFYSSLYESFSQMSLQRLSQLTGLSNDDAMAAQDRRFGEPLNWLGSPSEKLAFIKAVESLGGNILEGGRFLHLSDRTDKGVALIWLRDFLSQMLLSQPSDKGDCARCFTTIGLGDGNNDIAMLDAADISVIVKSPVNKPPVITKTNNVFYTTLEGPEGWAESINNLVLKSRGYN